MLRTSMLRTRALLLAQAATRFVAVPRMVASPISVLRVPLSAQPSARLVRVLSTSPHLDPIRHYETAHQTGRKLTAAEYLAAISSYIRTHQLGHAESVLDRMRAAGLRPATAAYTALITGYSAAKNIDAVEKLYAEINKTGIDVDDRLISAIVQCYAVKYVGICHHTLSESVIAWSPQNEH